MRYFVVYVWGSCRAEDRNGGVMDCDTLEEARKEIADLLTDHPDATWKLIHGEEVERS